jgi:putative nucleotidyltransferase with HDIG domain
MMYPIEQFIQEASALPPIPQTAQKALAIIRDPETDAVALAKILAADQVLSAQVLRWANSAYYGMENRIATVQQAIVVLGMDIIAEAIMTSSVSGHLQQALPGYGLEEGELWQHSLGTAIGAQLISKKYHLRLDDEAYFAGLLCDIGKLVFEKHLREIDMNHEGWKRQSFLDVERLFFGIDHASLGAELACHWQLPQDLVTAITFHHEPQCATGHKELVAAIHIADISMKVLQIGVGIDGLRYPMEEDALQTLNMTWEELFVLSEEVGEKLKRAKQLLSVV